MANKAPTEWAELGTPKAEPAGINLRNRDRVPVRAEVAVGVAQEEQALPAREPADLVVHPVRLVRRVQGLAAEALLANDPTLHRMTVLQEYCRAWTA